MSDLYTLDLQTATYGGESLGRLPDGRAVFVPYALPGERVRVQLTETRRSFARARLLEVLRPAPQRIAARCPHFGVCGGCHYQHLSYPDQCALKTSLVQDQLQRIGKLNAPPVQPILPATSPWNYRNSIQFHLDELGRLSYQQANSHQLVAIRECHLPQTAINDLWPRLEFEPESGITRVTLRQGKDEDLLLLLEGDEPNPPAFELDLPLSAVYSAPTGEIVLSGESALLMPVHARDFVVSAQSFFQVNNAQAGQMVTWLLENLPITPNTTLLEVYCGVGLFSVFLAPHVARLIGVELAPSACDDFAINLDEFDHVELYLGAAEEVLPALQLHPDIVLVDPPRAGLERPALDALLRMAAPYLAYISCDLATLARDTNRLLAAGYQLQVAQPIDMFPQTGHIETLCLFTHA